MHNFSFCKHPEPTITHGAPPPNATERARMCHTLSPAEHKSIAASSRSSLFPHKKPLDSLSALTQTSQVFSPFNMTAVSDKSSRRHYFLLPYIVVPLITALYARLRDRKHTPPPPSRIVFPSPIPPELPTTPAEIALRDELLQRIHHLATISTPATPYEPGVNRPFLSPAGTRARTQLHQYMAQSGLSPRTDPAGNVIGDLRCSTSKPRRVFAMGSHFDSVRGGGMWDGVYGVVSAIAVVSVIAQRAGGICSLPFDLRVVAFDDEEGNNPFGTTNFGAKAYAGVLNLKNDVADLAALAARYEDVFPDFQVELMPDVHKALESRVKQAAVQEGEVLGFVELHIEQGPVLERRGMPVGVVDAIAGQTRFSVSILGKGGHAGTVPMGGRRDALAAAAEAVGIVEEVGLGIEGVATVGVLQVEGGSSNVIPGHVGFTIDLRAPQDSVRESAKQEILDRLRKVGERRGVTIELEVTHEIGAVSMTPWLRGILEDVVGGQVVGGCHGENCSRSLGGSTLTSGAGHDTQFMSKVTDVAMLFVRCRDGLSHHPDEHVMEEDAFEGARALLQVVDAVAERTWKGCVN